MGSGTGLVPIGVAAKTAGVSRQSLQYYLMVGLLEPTEVTSTGRRFFDRKSIERIKLVKKLNDNGYPLRDIREIFFEGRANLSATQPNSSRSGRRKQEGGSRSRKGSRR